MEWLLAILIGSFASGAIESIATPDKGGSIMSGLPVEMITMLGSSLLGGFMSIWGQSIKAKQAEQKMLLARGKFQMDEIEVIKNPEKATLPFVGFVVQT